MFGDTVSKKRTIFPLVFILVLFPNGRLLSSRWRWLLYVGVGLMLLIVVTATLSTRLAPAAAEDWSFANPIGFLDPVWFDANILPVFFVILPVRIAIEPRWINLISPMKR